MDDTTMTQIIHPEGDIILIIGDKKAKVRLRVSSTILGTASRVFKVMFGPNFAEGQGLGTTAVRPKEIVLAFDNPEAMVIICHLLHFQLGNVAPKIPSGLVLRLAKIVDKYLLHEACKYAVEKWLNLYDYAKADELFDFLQASVLLAIPSITKKITRASVHRYAGSFHTALGDTAPEDVLQIAVKMKQKREQLQILLTQAMHEIIAAAMSSSPCRCSIRFTEQLLKKLEEYELSPKIIFEQPLSWSLMALDTYAYLEEESRKVDCTLSTCNKRSNLKDDLVVKVDSVKEWNGFSEEDLQDP